MDIVKFLHLVLLADRIWFWICVANWGYPSRILANLGLRKAYCPEEQSLYFKQLAPDEITASLETHLFIPL